MSIPAMAWAWGAKCPSPTAKLVLLTLAYRANGKPVCWPSFAAIATDCGIDRKNVPRYIRQLADAGLIAVNRRAIKSAQANEYVLNVRTPCSHHEDRSVVNMRTEVSSNRGRGVSSERHTKQEVSKEEEGSAVATLLLRPEDPVQDLWDRGLAILGQRQRSLLGRMRKNHGDEAVLAAIIACEIEHPSEPASFFIACCARSPPARNGHDKDSPVTKLYRGGMRAADKLDREEADRRAGRSPALPLLDG